MINPIFNSYDYQVLPKQKEIWDKYCKIIQWGRRHPTRFVEDFFNLQLTDYQKYIFLNTWCASTAILLCSRATGKATSLDTKVWLKSKDGCPHFKTVGELKVGDKIYDAHGKLVDVIHLNPIIFDEYYEVEFSDGEIIKCNGEHLWLVHDRQFSKKYQTNNDFRLLNTDYIYHHFAINRGQGEKNWKEYNFRVPINEPLQYAKSEYLPIDPYVLGCYLGDGCITSDVIVSGDKDVEDLLKNKHIPERYLYGDVNTRLELLQGLMDTDGTIDEHGKCEFVQTDKQMIDDVAFLIRSLGMKCTVMYKQHTGYIKKDGTEADSWRVYFTTTKKLPVFKLKRKYDRLPEVPQIGTDRKAIVDVRLIKEKIPMRCITVRNQDGLFLCGEHLTITHNSFLSAPFIMARSILVPNHKTYIMSVSGGQASATFSKMEDLANGNIASAIGVSSIFLENVKAANSKTSGFTHGKEGMHVELFNGSEVTSLNSVPENLRGARSNLNVYDEAAFIPQEIYTASLPFTAVSSDFRTSKDLNPELYPKQLPNLNVLLSSASDVSSEMYVQYREAFRQMMLGNRNYFVADLDYHISTAPFMNGKPMHPLVSMDEVKKMYETQPYKAEREYANKWSGDQGEQTLIKRGTLEKYSQTMYPDFRNDGSKKYIITYDPAGRGDNSCIAVAELFKDEQKGLMLKFVLMKNLVEVLKNGTKAIIQRPEQVEILKQTLLDFNFGYQEYEGIQKVDIDGGAGGGGFEVSQYLLTQFEGTDKKTHRGIIDKENEYMALRADDYPEAAEILTIFNFKKNKTVAYESTEAAINQGLVIFPKGLNIRNEMEIEETAPDGSMRIRYEKPSLAEVNALIQFDLAKEELLGMQKTKKSNGTVVVDQTPEAKANGLHDDRADCIAMACYELMKLRSDEALAVEQKESDFAHMFQAGTRKKKGDNPFGGNIGSNPFANKRGFNPFSKR